MTKIKIVVKRDDDRDRPTADVDVFADGVKVASGCIGGEPEDNTIGRDYAWVTGAIADTAKACGAEVEIEDNDD